MGSFTKRRLSNGIFRLPAGWEEINPQKARDSREVIVCCDNDRNIAVYYSSVPACELTEDSASQICGLAKESGLNDAIGIFGIVNIQGFAHDVGGAEIIHKKTMKGDKTE